MGEEPGASEQWWMMALVTVEVTEFNFEANVE
jgi:hypothetical protein